MLGWAPPLKFYTSVHAISLHGGKAEQGNTDLASEFGNAEGFAETGPLVDIGLQVNELDVIPVDSHLVHVAVTAALVEEVGHPRETVGVGGRDGASESVTLVGERPEVLVPDADSVVRAGLSLGVFVDPGKGGSVLSG